MMSEGGSSPFLEHVQRHGGSPLKQVLSSNLRDESRSGYTNYNNTIDATDSAGFNESGIVDHEDLKKRVLYLEYKLNNCLDENEVMKLNYESKLEELSQELSEVHEEKESLTSDQRILLDTNTELNEENEQLRSQLQVLENEKNKIRESSQIFELRDSLNISENQNAELKSRLHKVTRESEMKLSNKDQLIQELEGANENLNTRCNELIQKIKYLDQSMVQLKTTNDKQDEAKARKLYEDECRSQLEYIRELEHKNLEMSNKLRDLKSKYEYSQFLKEDKKTLINKLNKFEDLQSEFDKLLVKYENSKRNLTKWESAFEDPRDVLIQIKTQQIENENNDKLIKDLRGEVNQLQDELIKLKSANFEINNDKNRLGNLISEKELDILKLIKLNELQKKEIGFLNDRLVNLSEENTLILSNKKLKNSNELANKRIEELSKLCQEYKEEVNKAKDSYDEDRKNSNNKRLKLENDSENRVKQLQFDLNNKSKEIQSLNDKVNDLKKLNDRLKESVKSAQQSRPTGSDSIDNQKNSNTLIRVLELKDNPTARFEKGTMKMLHQLKIENNELISQIANLHSNSNNDTTNNNDNNNDDDDNKTQNRMETIPRSVYDRIYLEQLEYQEEIANLNKKMKRLTEYYSKETRKFNEVLFNLLGYKVEILTDSKLKLISKFFKSDEEHIIINLPSASISKNTSDKFSKVEIGENDIKLNNAEIQEKLNNFIKFWIYDKNELSCFLSALNLELFETIDSHN